MSGLFTGELGGIRALDLHLREKGGVFSKLSSRTQNGGEVPLFFLFVCLFCLRARGAGKIQHRQYSRGSLCGFDAVNAQKVFKINSTNTSCVQFRLMMVHIRDEPEG